MDQRIEVHLVSRVGNHKRVVRTGNAPNGRGQRSSHAILVAHLYDDTMDHGQERECDQDDPQTQHGKWNAMNRPCLGDHSLCIMNKNGTRD